MDAKSNKLSISLSNGNYIVAELCEYSDEFPPEVAICIQDENGVAIQDIVLVREAKTKEPGVTVLVWNDGELPTS